MSTPTAILGLHVAQASAAACVLVDGQLVTAAQEDRFRRSPAPSGFPAEAARWCLAAAGIAPEALAHVALSCAPRTRLVRRALRSLIPGSEHALERELEPRAAPGSRLAHELARAFGHPVGALRPRVHRIDEARAQLASAFLVSPYERAALASIGGCGELASAVWGVGEDRRMHVLREVARLHSPELLVRALARHLGLPASAGAEQAHALARLACGAEATRLDEVRRLVRLERGGGFALALERLSPAALAQRFGPARSPEAAIEPEQRELAASLQVAYEEVYFHLLEALWQRTQSRYLCLASSTSDNALAIGRIRARTEFREVWVPSSAGEAGRAIGAACATWNQVLGRARSFVLRHAFLGPGAGSEECGAQLELRAAELRRAGARCERVERRAELCRRTAEPLAEGALVGWFQGRMEWGAHGLGNRNLLVDPRRPDLVERVRRAARASSAPPALNLSVLREDAPDWLECEGELPFLAQSSRLRSERCARLPALGRATLGAHTVARDQNALFHELLSAFHRRTGVPLLASLPLDAGRPLPCQPGDALDGFLASGMDVLVLGDWFVERTSAARPALARAA